MTTDANLVGGGDNANPKQTNGSNIKQTVVSDLQAAIHTAQPEAIPPVPKTSVILPRYLELVTDSREGVANFRKFLGNILVEYTCSDYFRKLPRESKFDDEFSFHSAILLLVERAANQKLGPEPDEPVKIPDDILENFMQPEAYEAYQNNPFNCTDVDHLQEWVRTLQQMNEGQVRMIDGMNRLQAASEKESNILNQLVETHAGKSKDQAQIIEILEGQIERLQNPKQPVPRAKNYISFDLDVEGLYSFSQAELVRRVLTSYRDTKIKATMSQLVNGENSEAHCNYRDYELANEVLDLLSEALQELAHNNNLAAAYSGNPDGYRRNLQHDLEVSQRLYSQFVESVGLRIDTDDEEAPIDEPTSEAETTPEATPEPDPEYLQGLNDIDRAIMLDFKKKIEDSHAKKAAEGLMKLRREYFPDTLTQSAETPAEPLTATSSTDTSTTEGK